MNNNFFYFTLCHKVLFKTNFMDINKQLKDIAEIKDIMNKSSRFISLSGLSGIFAGVFALIGAFLVYYFYSDFFVNRYSINSENFYYLEGEKLKSFIIFSLIDGLAVLTLAISFGLFFTIIKARKNNQKIWDNTTKRILINLFIPLVSGGIFIIALVYHHLIFLIAPVTLVFYGIALVNVSKYTFRDVKFLGISEISIGLFAMFYIGYGLVFWALGFGVLNIIYGISMYLKYDKK